MMSTRAMPSRWWYVVALIVSVVGLVGYLIYAIYVISMVFTNIHRMKMPGEYIVDIDKPGVYRIFHEYVSRIDGENFRTNKEDYRQISIAVISERTKKQILLLPDSREQYNDNDIYVGFSIYKFEIDESGPYVIRAGHEDGKEAPNIIISIKPSLSSQIGRPILLSSLYSIVVFSLTGIIFWTTFIKRRKAIALSKQGYI